MAEAILNRKNFPNFAGYSAGSHPTGRVHPEALNQIASADMPTEGCAARVGTSLRSRQRPQFTLCSRVCDRAAAEVCPIWHGHPLTARWGVPDPDAVQGTPEETERAFLDAFTILDRGISLFLSLPIDRIGRQ